MKKFFNSFPVRLVETIFTANVCVRIFSRAENFRRFFSPGFDILKCYFLRI